MSFFSYQTYKLLSVEPPKGHGGICFQWFRKQTHHDPSGGTEVVTVAPTHINFTKEIGVEKHREQRCQGSRNKSFQQGLVLIIKTNV